MAIFINLPPEMRNSIYNMLLTDSTPNLSMLAAARLLHEEAASYFYQHSAFAVDLLGERTAGASILPPIPDKYLKYLRRLTINVCLNTSWAIDYAERIEALANTDATLSTLVLNFTSNTSRVLSRTVDDCVLHASHPLTLAMTHVLHSSAVQSVRVNLDNVWFTPGLATQLFDSSQGRLELLTSCNSLERALVGRTTHSHLFDLGLEARDLQDAEDLHHASSYPLISSSLPSSLSSALSELDQFSPTDFLGGEAGDLQGLGKIERVDSLFDEPIFDVDDFDEGTEEGLDKADDVDDEDMMDVDDFDAILENMEEVAHRRANEMDVCYMTNFAPELMGRWIGQAA